MNKETIEKIADFECEIENILSVIREDEHNPNAVLIGYLLENLTTSQTLLKALIEIESKK